MTGSVQIKNGKYYAVLRYRAETGYKYKWIATGLSVRGNKRRADELLHEYLNQYKDLDVDPVSKPLFTDYAMKWLANKKEQVREITWEAYESYLRTHIIPYFAPMNLTISDVTPKHINDFTQHLLTCERADHKKGGLSMRSVRKYKPVLNQIFDQAIIDGYISTNPVSAIKLPKVETEIKGTFLTAEEANKVLDAFRGKELQGLVYTTLYYGMRRSEVLGLKWDAIDFENNTIEIKHTVVKITTVVAADTTKNTSSRRVYPLLPEVKELLIEIRNRQSENKKTFGDRYYHSDYIFTWADGKPYAPDYVSKNFKNTLANNGIRPIRFHDLRHSTASILYDKGWQLKDIQEWLGHADIETTGNIYTHISKLRKEKVADDLSGTFTR